MGGLRGAGGAADLEGAGGGTWQGKLHALHNIVSLVRLKFWVGVRFDLCVI